MLTSPHLVDFVVLLRKRASVSVALHRRIQVVVLAYLAGELSFADTFPKIFRVTILERHGVERDALDERLADALVEWDCQEDLSVIEPPLRAKYPWVHGFMLVHRDTGSAAGRCGFNGPPDGEGMVEIASGVDRAHEGMGYATEAAAALLSYAFSQEQVRLVRAHTLPESNASTRVLTKCGFRRVGEVIDPEDGLIWRWERSK